MAVDGNTLIWKKPAGDANPPNQKEFGLQLCDESEDPSYAWYYNLKNCVSRSSSVNGEIAVGVIPKWPGRLTEAPSRARLIKSGLDLFEADTRRWVRRVAYYKSSLKVKLGTSPIRNIMDMNAFFGGFAAPIASDSVWVMNTVPAGMKSTLGIIYDRGLIGVYHHWCEPFSTYPRTYDLHVSGIQSLIKQSSNKGYFQFSIVFNYVVLLKGKWESDFFFFIQPLLDHCHLVEV